MTVPAAELRVGDVDTRSGNVTVRAETSKFKKSRVTHFHPEVGKELDRYLRQRPVVLGDVLGHGVEALLGGLPLGQVTSGENM